MKRSIAPRASLVFYGRQIGLARRGVGPKLAAFFEREAGLLFVRGGCFKARIGRAGFSIAPRMATSSGAELLRRHLQILILIAHGLDRADSQLGFAGLDRRAGVAALWPSRHPVVEAQAAFDLLVQACGIRNSAPAKVPARRTFNFKRNRTPPAGEAGSAAQTARVENTSTAAAMGK